MNDFTASNGITVFVREGGTVQFQDGTREESCGILQIMPGSEWWEALREFFQAEADERLGRWRWPENPAFICYPHDGQVFVTDERDGRQALISGDGVPGLHDYNAAARAYFDAHPDPKPWHDAIRGEVWEITQANQEPALYVVENTEQRFLHVERRLLALSVDDANITAGRRIWPEVSS